MRNFILTVFTLSLLVTSFGQPPQAFKYQAVVRDNTGEILQNQPVGIRISIHDATAGGTIIYQETFTETTNQFGLVNPEIGNGTPTIGTFYGIDWGINSKFLEVEIDPAGGSSYVSMGTSQLLSIPYAMYAETANIADDGDWTISGNYVYNLTDSIGIGTSSPHEKLEIDGNIIMREGADRKIFVGDPEGAIGHTGYGLLIKAGDGKSSFNHGYKGGDLIIEGGNGSYALMSGISSGGDVYIYGGEKGGGPIFGSNGDIIIGHTGTEVRGKVGIGTTNPGARLEVAGHIWQTGTGQSVFIGEGAGANDNLGDNKNSFIGYQCGYSNISGYYNTANGSHAGSQAENNIYCTFIGYYSNTNNTTSRINSMALGWESRIMANNQVRIGNNLVSSIGGYAGWTNLSDKRFKNNIKKDVPGLDFILKLQPVTYNMNVNKLNKALGIPDSLLNNEISKQAALEKEAIKQTGFIAHDVEQAALSIGYDFSGVDKPKNETDFYGLRYAEFVVPLVKGMQEQQVMIKEQQEMIEKQQAAIEELKSRIEELERNK